MRDSVSSSDGGSLPRVRWIVAAVGIGAIGAWSVLTLVAGRPAPASASAQLPTSAPPAAPSIRAADLTTSGPASVAHLVEPGAATAAGAVLDDATLVRLAQDDAGVDCPGVAERTPPTAAGFDITCTNGETLRVYALSGAAPRIGPRH